ncbi:MAG: pyridoxamine 5'-phosphate oxidase family protein [Bacillota bacterium]
MANILTPDQITMMAGDLTPKFLATRSADGRPNVVPVLSIQAADQRTVIFGEFLMWKTHDNLEADPRVAGLVITQDLRFFRFQARVREFVKAGRHFDQVSSTPMFRYNPYTGVRGVWVADLVEAEPVGKLSPLSVAAGFIGNRLGGPRAVDGAGAPGGSGTSGGPGDRRRVLPAPVLEKVNRMQALKVVATKGHDFPAVFPDLSLQAPDASTLRGGAGAFGRHYRDAAVGRGTELAVAVLTADPVAYQVKGVVAATAGSKVAVRVTEAFTATPPVPGKRIDQGPTAAQQELAGSCQNCQGRPARKTNLSHRFRAVAHLPFGPHFGRRAPSFLGPRPGIW